MQMSWSNSTQVDGIKLWGIQSGNLYFKKYPKLFCDVNSFADYCLTWPFLQGDGSALCVDIKSFFFFFNYYYYFFIVVDFVIH